VGGNEILAVVPVSALSDFVWGEVVSSPLPESSKIYQAFLSSSRVVSLGLTVSLPEWWGRQCASRQLPGPAQGRALIYDTVLSEK
jgi:hypothetical protein